MTSVWKSQAFDAEGSTTAPGILKQLGRPDLDEFTVLIREAAQNSWDARNASGDVDFCVRLERLGERSQAWRDLLLPSPPAASIDAFDKSLHADSWILIVSDRGTQGLGGPIRATERPGPDERNDFVQFLRNVGEPRDSALGGGTYGFGKGIFYRTSSVRTLLADTRVLRGGAAERRLMGAALGDDYYDNDNVRHTGRHWWGRIAEDGVIDPLLGEDAENASVALGLPAFEPDHTGTDIVVVGLDFALADDEGDASTPLALAEHLASAILWNLWPKFPEVVGNGQQSMRFRVMLEGHEILIPDPVSVPMLRPFVRSFLDLDGEPKSYVRTTHPKLSVGDFAVRIEVATSSGSRVELAGCPFEGRPHHVARMRQAGLIVDYHAGVVPLDSEFGYGGVFRASAEADEFFAAAEPPTHDGWNPEGLGRDARLVVQGAAQFLKNALKERFATPQVRPDELSPGLGRASHRLSGLVAGTRGTGAAPAGDPDGPGKPVPGGRGPVRPAAARLVGDPWIERAGDAMLAFAAVRVESPHLVESIKGLVDVVVEGGARETTAPTGSPAPKVLGWLARDDRASLFPGDEIAAFGNTKDWLLVSEYDNSLVIRFRLDVRSVSGE